MSALETAIRPGRRPADQRALIAVDLGAESCRVSLLRWVNGEPTLHLVHRFPNGPIRVADGSLRWPLASILAGVEQGIRRCAELAPEGVRSLAVDGWAVDYVRLDAAGAPLEEPYCYRDERNALAAAELHKRCSPDALRAITGIELQPLNTLYQLYADYLSERVSAPWLNVPEFCLAHLGAEPVAEYTNASHTQMVDLYAANWSREIFRAAKLDLTCAPRLVPAGTLLGKLTGPLASVPGLENTELVAPACHDTASAIAGISEEGEDWAYISCGTWSLVGTLIRGPLNGPAVRKDNFTNLGAVGGATCFHKSVNGMWLLKQCMDRWAQEGDGWELSELLAAAEALPEPDYLVEVDDPALLHMGNMPARINAQFSASGKPLLEEHRDHAPALTCMLLHSLASRYAEVLERVKLHTGKPLQKVVMVGGGAQNAMLRRLTAEKTGLQVVSGPTESSTIGNLAVQLSVLEEQVPVTSAGFARAVTAWARELGSLTMLPATR